MGSAAHRETSAPRLLTKACTTLPKTRASELKRLSKGLEPHRRTVWPSDTPVVPRRILLEGIVRQKNNLAHCGLTELFCFVLNVTVVQKDQHEGGCGLKMRTPRSDRALCFVGVRSVANQGSKPWLAKTVCRDEVFLLVFAFGFYMVGSRLVMRFHRELSPCTLWRKFRHRVFLWRFRDSEPQKELFLGVCHFTKNEVSG